MPKAFDCVEMKRKAQAEIYEETRGLSREEELAYYHRAAAEFWKARRARRAQRASVSSHDPTPGRQPGKP